MSTVYFRRQQTLYQKVLISSEWIFDWLAFAICNFCYRNVWWRLIQPLLTRQGQNNYSFIKQLYFKYLWNSVRLVWFLIKFLAIICHLDSRNLILQNFDILINWIESHHYRTLPTENFIALRFILPQNHNTCHLSNITMLLNMSSIIYLWY